MKIEARYIGKDGSMGFRKNHVYRIETYIDNNWLWVKVKGSHLKCPYGSLEKFLENHIIIRCWM